MNFNKYNIFFISLLFHICCCNADNEKHKSDLTSLHMNSAVQIDFDELVENVNCITLENLPDAYMTDCWKIIKYKDLFYLYSLSDFAVCIFDEEGKFIKRIDGKNTGAVETPCDIFVEKKQDQLWIVESHHFIHKYSLKGDFIAKEELPFSAVKLTCFNDNCFLFYDGGFDRESPFFVRQTSANFKTVKTFVEKTNKQYRSIPISLFANDDENKEIYSLLPNMDTVYISNKTKSFTPLFHLNFDNRLLTFDMFPQNGFSDKEMAEIIKTKKMVHSITGFNYASGLLFMQLHGKDDSFRIIDVNTKSVSKFNTLIDGLDMYPGVTTIQGCTDKSLLVSMSAKEFLEKYKKKNNLTHYKSIEKILDAPEKIKNRVLIEIKIKETYEK